MGIGRTLLCILFPPAAVLDRGIGTLTMVILLTLAGWIPGAIAALIINSNAAGIKKLEKRMDKQHKQDLKRQQQYYQQPPRR